MLCRIDAASWQWEVKIDRCILAKLMREIEIFLLVTSSIRKAFFFRLKIQPKTTGTAIVFKKKKKKKKKRKEKNRDIQWWFSQQPGQAVQTLSFRKYSSDQGKIQTPLIVF